MQRVYYHVQSQTGLLRDREGSDVTSLDEARDEAIQAAREMMSAAILCGRAAGCERSFVIADEAGTVLTIIPFTDALINPLN